MQLALDSSAKSCKIIPYKPLSSTFILNVGILLSLLIPMSSERGWRGQLRYVANFSSLLFHVHGICAWKTQLLPLSSTYGGWWGLKETDLSLKFLSHVQVIICYQLFIIPCKWLDLSIVIDEVDRLNRPAHSKIKSWGQMRLTAVISSESGTS